MSTDTVVHQKVQLRTVPFVPSASYGYHCACYSKFTNKVDVEFDNAEKLQQKALKTVPGIESELFIALRTLMFFFCVFVFFSLATCEALDCSIDTVMMQSQ